MRIVVALGGNALLKRGEPLTMTRQRRNVADAARALVAILPGNQLVITHGNGPQVGLLALQAAAAAGEETTPLDVLGAETEGQIGYMIEQELRNLLPAEVALATMLTMVEVDPADSAFLAPTKFIGPGYADATAATLAAEKGWVFRHDGDRPRRVVASPKPRRIFELRPITWLLDHGAIVIGAGGGGIPVARDAHGRLQGVEAVIDKDFCSELLARELDADLLVLATDADAVFQGWGTPNARAIRSATPNAILRLALPAGSMGPKVQAAAAFATMTGRPARIGALTDLAAITRGDAGTTISVEAGSTTYQSGTG